MEIRTIEVCKYRSMCVRKGDFDNAAMECHTKMMTFDLRPAGGEGQSHTDISKKISGHRK